MSQAAPHEISIDTLPLDEQAHPGYAWYSAAAGLALLALVGTQATLFAGPHADGPAAVGMPTVVLTAVSVLMLAAGLMAGRRSAR